MKHFTKKVNLNSDRDMFDFVKNHYTYYTMNSWNGLKSIANNVKVHKLPLKGDCYEALEALEDDAYYGINETIRNWEEDHPGFKIGFNGRSGGYLVLYGEKGYKNPLSGTCACYPGDYYNYEDWKADVRDYYGSLKNFRSELRYIVKMIQEFDELCDDLIDVTQNTYDDYKFRKDNTKEIQVAQRFQTFYYKDREVMRLHIKHMLQHGHKLKNKDDLTLEATFEIGGEQGVVQKLEVVDI